MDKDKREKLRERFLGDPLPHRLGGLAATQGRISSSARNSADPNVVPNLLDEAKHLIESTAADTEPETAAELVQMQTMITLWQQVPGHCSVWRLANGSFCAHSHERIKDGQRKNCPLDS